jgi:hypothetical protein
MRAVTPKITTKDTEDTKTFQNRLLLRALGDFVVNQ